MARTRQPVPVSCSQLSAFFSGTVSCPSRQTLHLPVGLQLEHCLSEFTSVTPTCVEYALERLSTVKVGGPDSIGTSLVKSCRQVLAPSLANLYNESLESGEVPDIYKLAHITPVYKSGSQHEVSNCRPISLLPVASKVLERLILSQCKSYFNRQPERGLPSEQFAYRRNHSCDDLLTIVINDWQRAIDKQKITGVVFVDVCKAFDSVNNQTLLCDFLLRYL